MEQQCKDKNNIISMKRYTIYLIRWQLSTPIIYEAEPRDNSITKESLIRFYESCQLQVINKESAK